MFVDPGKRSHTLHSSTYLKRSALTLRVLTHSSRSDLDLGEQLRTQQLMGSAGASSDGTSGVVDWSLLQVGCLTQCKVSEHAHYGVVMDVDVHEVRDGSCFEKIRWQMAGLLLL